VLTREISLSEVSAGFSDSGCRIMAGDYFLVVAESARRPGASFAKTSCEPSGNKRARTLLRANTAATARRGTNMEISWERESRKIDARVFRTSAHEGETRRWISAHRILPCRRIPSLNIAVLYLPN